MMPSSASCSLNVVATETLSNTASTATADASQRLALAQRDAELLVGRAAARDRPRRAISARPSASAPSSRCAPGSRSARCSSFAQSGSVISASARNACEPPFEQPLRLALLGRDEAHRVLAEAGRRGIGFDVGDEAVFVALLRERADRLLGCQRGAHRASIKSGVSSVGGFRPGRRRARTQTA